MSTPSNSMSEGVSADEKRAAVLRVAKGEPPDAVASSIGVPIRTLMDWVRKYESARQDAPESPDAEHVAALRDRPIGHSALGVSNAEIDYPELLKSVDPKYYESLTEEQRHDLIIKQAIAQEKVGYEKYAPKFFLPEDEDPFPEGRHVEQADMFTAREINRPLLIIGGAILGVTIGLALVKSGFNPESASWLILGLGAFVGVALTLIGAR
jgi:hypothetical protein